jgi:hypothetical protein
MDSAMEVGVLMMTDDPEEIGGQAYATGNDKTVLGHGSSLELK